MKQNLNSMQNIALEISLKPFFRTPDNSVEDVCRTLFTQWRPLVRETPVVSVLLWTADGSEILKYRGCPTDTFEWAYFVGGANPREEWDRRLDPEGRGLHTRAYTYIPDPPAVSYAALRDIVGTLKRIGAEFFPDKTIRVGETFDPGPEFAISDFKYLRHNEICLSTTMGASSFACAYTHLHADAEHYAGFPNGIPEGTPFGTFFGRQCAHFLADMGFDYLWLSNGFGFGQDTWSATGALFDGKRFDGTSIPAIRADVLTFWHLFRAECPDIPVETRGTNMSAGIDMATDGVSLAAIYSGGFGILPPPNSPWAAIDEDFSLELMGYLSHIAALPDDKSYLFRFYLHDPWWMNSPWYDRYNSMPHDIYLPMALSRIDRAGRTCPPDHLALLSVDNSLGELPDACADEATPHLRKAIKEAPDTPAPLVWVYPFDEYAAAQTGEEAARMFAGDWFVRGAIAEGLPVASVVSCEHFLGHDPALYAASVLLTPVPTANSPFEAAILSYAERGGRVIFYGSARGASDAFCALLGIRADEAPLAGDVPASAEGADAGVLHHDPILSDGALEERDTAGGGFAFSGSHVLAARQKNAVWLRGTVSGTLPHLSPRVLRCDPAQYFLSESLSVRALGMLGWDIRFAKTASEPSPVITLHRHDGALILATYQPSTTVETRLRFPLGAPILDGYEAVLRDGYACYRFPKAERRECRVFVEQQSGIVGVREIPPVSWDWRRRIEVHGLENATVRVFGENYCRGSLGTVLNGVPDYYFVGDAFDGGYRTDEYGTYYEARGVSGKFVFSMPRRGAN